MHDAPSDFPYMYVHLCSKGSAPDYMTDHHALEFKVDEAGSAVMFRHKQYMSDPQWSAWKLYFPAVQADLQPKPVPRVSMHV